MRCGQPEAALDGAGNGRKWLEISGTHRSVQRDAKVHVAVVHQRVGELVLQTGQGKVVEVQLLPQEADGEGESWKPSEISGRIRILSGSMYRPMILQIELHVAK